MRRSLLIVATLAASNWACGQGGFIVHLDELQAGRNGAGVSVRDVADGYLIFGRQLSQQFPAQSHLYVRKLDLNGEYQGEFEYLIGDDRSFDVGYIDGVCRSEGECYAAVSEGYGLGGDTWLYRFNDAGDTLSRHVILDYGEESSIVDGIRQIRPGGGGFVLCGFYNDTLELGKAYLVRTTNEGDTIWTKKYASPGLQLEALGVEYYQSEGYVLTGYSTNNANSSFLIRADANGNQIWLRTYGNDANVNGAVRVAADGGIITWSEYREPTWPNWYWQQMMLTKWNASGGIVWQKKSHYNDYVNTHDFEILPDGAFIATGTALLEAVLAKFSSTGDSLWSRSFTPTHGGSYLYDVQSTSDGGFIATGETFKYAPIDTEFQTNQIIWVVKTDSLGCVVPGCQNVGVREYALDMNEYLSVWPNPVGDVLNFSFAPPAELMPTGALRATLLDAAGRVVREEAFAPNTSSFTLTTIDLALGAYHLHLSDGQRWLAGRTVVKE